MMFKPLRLLFLAVLIAVPPASAEQIGLDELDLSLMTSGWQAPQANKSVAGEPLAIAGEKFKRGVGTHAPSEAMLILDGKGSRFRARVGINDRGREAPGSVVFQVFGDGKQLFASQILRGGDAAVPVDVSLAGVRQLRLVVTDAGDGRNSDHADWAEAVIEYAGAKPVLIDPNAPLEPAALYPPPDQRRNSPGDTRYFVDPLHGNDANDGSAAERAWQSLAKLNALNLAPGDSVLISPGRHRVTLKPSGAGTKEKPVTIRFLPGVHEFTSDEALRRPWFISNTGDDAFLPKPVAILVEDAKHLRIEGGGTDGAGRTLILMGGPTRTIQVVNHRAEDIAFSGLVFDLKRPTVSEFRVLEARPDSVVIRVAEGCTYEIKDGKFAWTGDLGTGWTMAQEAIPETGRAWRLDRWDPFASAVATDLGASRVRLAFPKGNPGMLKGRQFQFRSTLHDSVSFHNARSKDIVFKNCEVNGLVNMGFVSQFTENVTYQGVNIIPPKGTIRTCPAWSDGFHFANCRGQVLIESCRLSGMGDDAVNYHGIHLGIAGQPAENQLHLRFMQGQTFGFAPYAPGDELAVIDHNTLLERSGNPRRTVAAVSPLPGDSTGKNWLVTLDGPAPAFAPGDVVDNLTWQANVTVRSNFIELASCRGILVTTRGKAVIEDNTINSSMPGVLIEDDANFWWESSSVHDLIIRRNTFLNCGIEIAPQTLKAAGPVHENIRIQNNLFVGEAGANHYRGKAPFIKVSGVRGLTITGNRLPGGPDSIRTTDCAEVTTTSNRFGVTATRSAAQPPPPG
jgi:hypothetical protein